jgi:hypothetical protein
VRGALQTLQEVLHVQLLRWSRARTGALSVHLALQRTPSILVMLPRPLQGASVPTSYTNQGPIVPVGKDQQSAGPTAAAQDSRTEGSSACSGIPPNTKVGTALAGTGQISRNFYRSATLPFSASRLCRTPGQHTPLWFLQQQQNSGTPSVLQKGLVLYLSSAPTSTVVKWPRISSCGQALCALTKDTETQAGDSTVRRNLEPNHEALQGGSASLRCKETLP